MRKICCLVLLAAFLPLSALAMPEPSRLELDPDFLAQIHALFPEGQRVAPQLLDFHIDPNLHFFREAELLVTFIDEEASFRNSFGYFLYEDLDGNGEITEEEILRRELIFPNASKEGSGGDLKTGDTVSLGRFPDGTHLGFFLVSNGYDDPQETYYSLDALNPGEKRHLAMLALPDRQHVILGIEDLPEARSDRDFNDLLFTFRTEPSSALREMIEESGIPVAKTPPPSGEALIPSPSLSAELAEVGPQGSGGNPWIEGGGLSCSLTLGQSENGRPFSFSALILLYLVYRLWKRHTADIAAAFRLFKKRGCLYHYGKDYKRKLTPPSQWLKRI